MIDSFLFTILVDKFEVCKRNWVVRMVSPNIPVFIFNSFNVCLAQPRKCSQGKSRPPSTDTWFGCHAQPKKCENNPVMKMPMGSLENEELERTK